MKCVLLYILATVFLVAPTFATAEEKNAAQAIDMSALLAGLDEAQYTLSAAGAKELTASLLLSTDMEEELKYVVKADVTWSVGKDMAASVESKREKKYNPEQLREDILTYVDDLLLGPCYVKMLEGFDLTAQKDGEATILTASRSDTGGDIQSMIMTITPDLRISKIVFESQFAKATHVTLEHKQSNGKWYIVKATIDRLVEPDNEYLETIKSIECEYQTVNETLLLKSVIAKGRSGDASKGEEPIDFYYRVDVKDAVIKK